jgi:hypothetical protein
LALQLINIPITASLSIKKDTSLTPQINVAELGRIVEFKAVHRFEIQAF